GLASGARRPGPICLALVVVFVTLHPLLYLRDYYQQESRSGRTNGPILQTLDQIRALRSDEPVILDQPPQQGSLGPGGGWVSSVFRLALGLERVPYRLVNLDSADGLPEPRARCRDQLVVLA